MGIPSASINKPVSTFMIFAGAILLGFISLAKLPQELFPSITYPQITVVTSYENAAPEEIESLVTKIIEEATGTVNNVKRISSVSKEGISLVMVEFNWGANMDFAALNVREKIDLIKEKLPREAQEPIVMKYNPFDLPIMNLAVTGPLSPVELRETSRKYIKDAIEKIDGVASATISGGDEREILVEIDQARLRASQISIVSVVDSLKAANMNYPAGTLKENFYEYLIRTMGEFQKVGEIQETPTALDIPEENAKTQQEKEEKEKKGRRLVFLKDIAKTKDTVKEKTSISRYNAKDSVSIVIRKQSGANTINVVKGIKKEIDKILAEKLPKGIKIQTTYEQSQFIEEAIGNVRSSAFQGTLLAFLVLFFFLWDVKSSIIITLAIPISIMATFCLMYFAKINLNIMSLGGLALGVGMLVDNSVVVIENIFRLRQMDKSQKQACSEGADEMVAPIIGSTLTTVAVFLPFAFVVGIAGQVFKQLSLTITFSLVASIVVALSFVPMLMSLGREKGAQALKVFAFVKKFHLFVSQEKQSNRGDSAYERFLRIMLDNREKVLSIVFILFFMSLVILFTTERQFMPRVDQRQFIIKVDMPPGTRLETTDAMVKKVEGLLLKLPEAKDVTINIGSSEEKVSAQETALQTMGSHQAQIMVNLKKKSKKEGITRSTEGVIQVLKTGLDKESLQGAEIEYIAQPPSAPRWNKGRPVPLR
jgi:HAE1 family hydrophobic/amphiphilic exporter-1